MKIIFLARAYFLAPWLTKKLSLTFLVLVSSLLGLCSFFYLRLKLQLLTYIKSLGTNFRIRLTIQVAQFVQDILALTVQSNPMTLKVSPSLGCIPVAQI